MIFSGWSLFSSYFIIHSFVMPICGKDNAMCSADHNTHDDISHLPYHTGWELFGWALAYGNGEKWCIPARPSHKTPVGSTILAHPHHGKIGDLKLALSQSGEVWMPGTWSLPHWNMTKPLRCCNCYNSSTSILIQHYHYQWGTETKMLLLKYKPLIVAHELLNEVLAWHAWRAWPGPKQFTF